MTYFARETTPNDVDNDILRLSYGLIGEFSDGMTAYSALSLGVLVQQEVDDLPLDLVGEAGQYQILLDGRWLVIDQGNFAKIGVESRLGRMPITFFADWSNALDDYCNFPYCNDLVAGFRIVTGAGALRDRDRVRRSRPL